MPSSAANQSARALSIVCVDQRAVMAGRARRGQIGAIDREMQHVEFQRLPQAVRGIVARGIMPAGDARQQAGQHGEFAGEQGLQHAPLWLPSGSVELRRLAADLPPDLVERLEAVAVDQDLGDRVHPLIAGGAVDAAEVRQLFVLAEDLLDHHVERLGAVPCASRIRRRRRWKYCAGSRRPSMWSSRRPCSLSSAISRLTRRWVASKVPASSTRRPASELTSKKRR